MSERTMLVHVRDKQRRVIFTWRYVERAMVGTGNRVDWSGGGHKRNDERASLR